MARAYYWCDYPTNGPGGKCMKPARRMAHGGLCLCEVHAARLPFWPTDDAEDAVTPREGAQVERQASA